MLVESFQLEVDRTDYFQNVLNMNKFEQIAWNKQLKEGENRQEWLFHTFDVIAQYANPWNELMVPAGVLQFPMFDNDVPHYLNFGSTGSILGHELLHAVDEIGQVYDVFSENITQRTLCSLENYNAHIDIEHMGLHCMLHTEVDSMLFPDL